MPLSDDSRPAHPLPHDVLDAIDILTIEEIDFTATDTEAILAKVRLLTAAATYFNTVTVSQFGGRLGPARSPGLPEQVVAAAFQTYSGVDPHPGAFDKAAMLLRGITQGHPFDDGNKRTGFLTAAYYLEKMGYSMPEALDVDAVVVFCMEVSAGTIRDVGIMARTLKMLWRRPTQDAADKEP